ncbi:serine/threonine-protein kinase [Umezawaea tangerina]|uniref:non-specific serine/threonine protein kinase n=1 Tax=Umezawaea tangerina TaxID=84725 RepID=A0A2T0SVC5_9PSEU|nr:serine/threonine-protein kinase [Umezawaea tangerina]PRY37362.1 serine/threonine protein kinase [Umezawaea tangerina]
MATDDELMAWAPRATTRSGIALAGYSDFRMVAQGGEGTVYRARQDGLGRDVAVKVLAAADDATLARFRRELEITVRLGRQHPHIVTVLDTGVVQGRPCIVMEFHDLGSLHDRLLARGPLPVADVVAAGIAVADALAFAHGQGVLHRDVKPQNVLVLPTSYVLADFGIARAVDAGHSASLQLVSYRHAAPQMVDGEKPAATDDVWSLGSTLFTLLDGKPPFSSADPDEDTMLAYLGRVRSAPPRPLRRTDVPPDLLAVVDRCLRKAREDRFPDAASLRAALAAVDTAWAPTPSTVDPDSTRAVVPLAPPQLYPEGPTALPDFGPRPRVEEEPPAPAVQEEPKSWADQLADLTVRHHPAEPEVPDFGPRPGNPADAPDFGLREAGPSAPGVPDSESGAGAADPTTDVRSAEQTTSAGQDSTSDSPTSTAVPDSDSPANRPVSDERAVPDQTPPDHAPEPPTAVTPARPAPFAPSIPVVPFTPPPPVAVVPATSYPVDRTVHEPVTQPSAPPRSDPPVPRRHLRWLVPLAIVAIVGGAVLGVVLTRPDDRSQAAPPTTSSAASTSPAPPSTPDTSANVPAGTDPRFSPVLNRVEVLSGTTIELDWTDPSDGRAQFVVVDVTGKKPEPLVTVAAGTTTHLLEGLDTAGRRYCFQILAIGLDDPGNQRGSSARTCTSTG